MQFELKEQEVIDLMRTEIKPSSFRMWHARMIGDKLVYNISRSSPEITHPNLKHFAVDVLQDTLPEIENIDTLIYAPDSINLKPEEVANMADFLISENAKSISGQVFEMDYGIVTFKI